MPRNCLGGRRPQRAVWCRQNALSYLGWHGNQMWVPTTRRDDGKLGLVRLGRSFYAVGPASAGPIEPRRRPDDACRCRSMRAPLSGSGGRHVCERPSRQVHRAGQRQGQNRRPSEPGAAPLGLRPNSGVRRPPSLLRRKKHPSVGTRTNDGYGERSPHE